MLVALFAKPLISFHLRCCMLGGSVWLWMKSNLFCEVRWGWNLSSAPFGMPTWVWHYDSIEMCFVWTSSLPLSRHWKLTKHGGYSIHSNQYPPEDYIELKDNLVEWSSNSPWLWVRSCLFYIQNLPCLLSVWCMLGGIAYIWTKNIHYWLSLQNYCLEFKAAGNLLWSF